MHTQPFQSEDWSLSSALRNSILFNSFSLSFFCSFLLGLLLDKYHTSWVASFLCSFLIIYLIISICSCSESLIFFSSSSVDFLSFSNHSLNSKNFFLGFRFNLKNLVERVLPSSLFLFWLKQVSYSCFIWIQYPLEFFGCSSFLFCLF